MTTAVEPPPAVRSEEELEAEFADLPWWRRPRRLRRQLAGTLVLVALASVVLVGGLNFVAARQLLDDGTQDQLVGVGEARARSIDQGLARILTQVSALAADLSVVEALEGLDAGFADLAGLALDDDEQAELERWYTEVAVDPLNALGLGLDVSVADVLPITPEARYAQYHYVVAEDLGSRRDVVDAGDGSSYSATHAEFHPVFVGIEETLESTDLLLINAAGDVVYSVEKRIEFGTSLVGGPYADTNLATTVIERLSRVPVGEAIIADLEVYLPGGARPVAFIVSAVRRDTQVIGAVAVPLTADAINRATTADGRWEEVGLSSGESYLVGSDRVLRSESREWLEDPAGYLDRIDDPELITAIEAFDSPVGIQPVATEAVDEALDGQVFEGTTRNYLDRRTFTYARPIDAPGVTWVVVADIPLSSAREPLYDYATRLGLVLLIMLPIAAVVGLRLAGRLTRPIPPVVEAALDVAAGERDPDVPSDGRDEFGDLARRLKQLAHELEEQEAELAAEFENRRRLLLTVLPPRVVRDDGVVLGSGDIAETGTVVAVSVDPGATGVGDETEAAAALSQALVIAEQLAAEHDVERIRAAADQYLFIAGLGQPTDAADDALAFATALVEAIGAHTAEVETPLGLHLGLSSGPVATGMLEKGNLTFAAWGEPVRRALAIGALASLDEVLVDESTVASSDSDRWSYAAATDVVALDGQTMRLSTVAARSTPGSDAEDAQDDS